MNKFFNRTIAALYVFFVCSVVGLLVSGGQSDLFGDVIIGAAILAVGQLFLR